MSSTLRLFLNDNRISTAVKTKTGSILQVYPLKATFADEVAWREHWDFQMKPKILLRIGDSEDNDVPVSNAVAAKPKWSKLSDWTVTKKKHFEHTLPAGTYYIGDLCYVLGNDVYDGVFGGAGYTSGIYEEKGTNRTFLVSDTACGDGTYEGSDGNSFSVDAGIIGICSASLIAKHDGAANLYTFDKPVVCDFSVGHFTFLSGSNSMEIDTTDSYDV